MILRGTSDNLRKYGILTWNCFHRSGFKWNWAFKIWYDLDAIADNIWRDVLD